MLTIAHRLQTIADYDTVVVMDEGRIVEKGSPFELLNEKGVFYRMVLHTGKRGEQIFKIAEEAEKERLYRLE